MLDKTAVDFVCVGGNEVHMQMGGSSLMSDAIDRCLDISEWRPSTMRPVQPSYCNQSSVEGERSVVSPIVHNLEARNTCYPMISDRSPERSCCV
jgi:hypothetical protein